MGRAEAVAAQHAGVSQVSRSQRVLWLLSPVQQFVLFSNQYNAHLFGLSRSCSLFVSRFMLATSRAAPNPMCGVSSARGSDCILLCPVVSCGRFCHPHQLPVLSGAWTGHSSCILSTPLCLSTTHKHCPGITPAVSCSITGLLSAA